MLVIEVSVLMIVAVSRFVSVELCEGKLYAIKQQTVRIPDPKRID